MARVRSEERVNIDKMTTAIDDDEAFPIGQIRTSTKKKNCTCLRTITSNRLWLQMTSNSEQGARHGPGHIKRRIPAIGIFFCLLFNFFITNYYFSLESTWHWQWNWRCRLWPWITSKKRTGSMAAQDVSDDVSWLLVCFFVSLVYFNYFITFFIELTTEIGNNHLAMSIPQHGCPRWPMQTDEGHRRPHINEDPWMDNKGRQGLETVAFWAHAAVCAAVFFFSVLFTFLLTAM
jgi:hypothetical protein